MDFDAFIQRSLRTESGDEPEVRRLVNEEALEKEFDRAADGDPYAFDEVEPPKRACLIAGRTRRFLGGHRPDWAVEIVPEPKD
jgi:hypothetical protein